MTRSLPLLALALALSACGGDKADADATAADSTSTAAAVETLTADPGLFEDVIDLTGTVATNNDAALSPDVPGTLTFVAAVGTAVRAGQTVAQVRATGQQAGVAQAQAGVAQSRAGIAQAQAQVATAEAGVRAARAQRQAAQAQLDLAQDQYRRQLPLVRDSILSALEFRSVETQLANARSGVAQADAGIAQAQGQVRAAQQGVVAARAGESASQAGVRSAQTQLGNTRVVAPFAGVVQERLMGPGELASPGMPVVRIVSGGAVKIEAGVPERYAGAIRVGAQVSVTPTANAGGARGGRVTFVGVAVNPQTRTFPVEIQVDNSDGALKPAMVVRLGITREILENVVVVPQEAVVRDERGTSVFVAEGPEGSAAAVRREVELGPTSGDNVVIRSGVRTGEAVIVSGQSGLAEGDRVRISERRAPIRTAATAPATAASEE